MKYLHNDFITASHPNYTVDSWGHSYVFNENGHRSPSVDSLDKSNYILFAGCSHTEGIGLPVEYTYPYLTSQQLNSNYYNLGIGGSGCDVMFYNIMMWFNKFKHKPKLLVIQWPNSLRYIHNSNVVEETAIQTEGSWSNDTYLNFLLLGDEIGYFHLRTKLYFNILNKLGVPLIHVSFPGYNRHLENYIEFVETDKAFDGEHLGPISHHLLANNIVKEYHLSSDKYIDARDNNNIRGQITSQ